MTNKIVPKLVIAILLILTICALKNSPKTTDSAGKQPSSEFYNFEANLLGTTEPINFKKFMGRLVIVVNAASYCSLTKSNYTGLSKLLDSYHGRGLDVLLFPCNQFANQERDDPEKIKEFVEKYDKRFILAEKVNVNGSEAHPLFKWLKSNLKGFLVDAVKWNFTKFLIDAEGKPVMRLAPTDDPSKLESKIEELLSKK